MCIVYIIHIYINKWGNLGSPIPPSYKLLQFLGEPRFPHTPFLKIEVIYRRGGGMGEPRFPHFKN